MSNVATVVRSIFEPSKKNPFTDDLVKTHLWIYFEETETVEVAAIDRESEDNPIYQHSQVWGEKVWDIHVRGYFYANENIISSHCKYGVSRIEKKLVKEFDKLELAILYATWAN